MTEQATAIEKAVDVLFHLHRESTPQGVTAVGRALGLPKSSAHRLLASLCSRGLVERDERGRYRTGMGLVALGLGALEREPIVVAARPVLEAEAQALGETVFLVGARAGSLVVLDKAEGTGFLRAAPRVGSAVPVDCTAVGKLFLAFDPHSLGAPDLPRPLARAVERARALGHAENRDEWIPGLSVVAAPVLSGGRMPAALAVAIPSARMRSLDRLALARRAAVAAARIAARMEGRDA
ncbi:MAG: IclR family transcriptional regulator [Myxococcales bacterium]|nr:IclR family transcriptional regulator [Myxococcales bacterium]MDH5307977.1 IclR family transcriptional regulator [Myxococcales bacterium]MDH5565375.1 IclR family transcriptional regulator [Myxococcales bacterium]